MGLRKTHLVRTGSSDSALGDRPTLVAQHRTLPDVSPHRQTTRESGAILAASLRTRVDSHITIYDEVCQQVCEGLNQDGPSAFPMKHETSPFGGDPSIDGTFKNILPSTSRCLYCALPYTLC